MIKHERGYLIPAINNDQIDYEACAKRLASSILDWHPQAHVTILTQDQLPFGKKGGYQDDWQIWWASPYRQTIKLEADMVATGPIDHWWTFFEHRDLVISQGARDWRDRLVSSRRYRKIFDVNHLPDVYNAITYWRVSATAKQFFHLVKFIFEDWKTWRQLLKFPDDQPSTDLVYAMAAVIIGTDHVTMPEGTGPTIVHMKQHAINGKTENWTQELIWERVGRELSIQTIRQWGLFHYHIKNWS